MHMIIHMLKQPHQSLRSLPYLHRSGPGGSLQELAGALNLVKAPLGHKSQLKRNVLGWNVQQVWSA